ncbi:Sorbitol dehydrogenase (plasmid) [Rhodococcus opacus PD630]|nr:Sorbitol dehydrogenase [Rhodococcus opacus PD630]
MRDQELVRTDMAIPEPGPGEVLVKTLACGICGSDLHVLKHGPEFVEASRRSGGIFNMDLSRDVVMGHEFCAEVVDFGPDTTGNLKQGDRVCSMPLLVRPDSMHAVGYSNDNPGGFGEYMRLSEALLLRVPNGLPTEQAALTEPLAVGVHAVARSNIQKDETALVIGCGTVGLAVIAALRLRGVRRIVAADFSPRRRELAVTMGADSAIDPAETSPYENWADAVNPGQPIAPLLSPDAAVNPTVIFECVGVKNLIDQVMIGAPQGGRIIVAGVCMDTDSFQPLLGINKELEIRFSLGYTPEEFSTTLDNIAEGALPTTPLITGRVGLDGIAQAFQDLGSPDHHAKILVEPWR